MIRSASGNLVEGMLDKICSNIKKITGKNLKSIIGTQDKIRLCNGDIAYIDLQVDQHIYVNNKLVGVFEIKSYADDPMLMRASNDVRRIKSDKGDIKGFVLSIEKAAKIETEKYILNENYIDKVFYLTDGTRSSSRPLYKPEFRKEIKKEELSALYNTIENL